MPKAMQYTKGSIIYFSGDRDERIFILQQGLIVLTSTDIETGVPQTEHIKRGEFFGVKSALGHFPREETATVVADSVAIALNVAEFEKMFSENKAIIMKHLPDCLHIESQRQHLLRAFRRKPLPDPLENRLRFPFERRENLLVQLLDRLQTLDQLR